MNGAFLSPDMAIRLVAQSLNIWLASTGETDRVSPRDIVVTRRDGVLFLAFAEERPAPAPPGKPINRQQEAR